ncbi:methylation-associated defense system ATP-binding protein MAD8 [Vibrio coralliilyticus]|uniref:methylation-associated defense system ATP-binding protein MAD8 n=1 Tax=Vibrio coralliilyticus TaxID=190893 RepID=UPI001E2DA45F|nr:ATP-binding protein [Vibrio coralliilyticus]MCC2523579.1 ATP-binding protein [Vibrio coralliilyticus]
MIKGIQTVGKGEIRASLVEALVPKLTDVLSTRGVGHCMKVVDLETDLMLELAETLVKAGGNYQVVVLSDTGNEAYSVTSTKLVELRNPDKHGLLRAPLLVFVPNDIKTSSEDSFGEATFEQIDVSDAYSIAFDTMLSQAPASVTSLLSEVRFILNDKGSLKLTEYQWLRYILTLKQNSFDPAVLGAALFELGLVPDLELHQEHATLVRRLVKNYEVSQQIKRSDKSPIATVYELQLVGEEFNRQLALFLNDQDSLLSDGWQRKIVTDSSNWQLTFDKWAFNDEEEITDSVFVNVTDLSLPVIPDDETNPALQELIGQQVLTIGQGGIKKFGVTFEIDPKPQEVAGLTKFKAQVFTQQGDFVGLIKVARATKRAVATINFTKLTGLDWQEGWHYVRVQAFDDNDELLPLIDEYQNPIPWGTSSSEDAGSRPNESELFYVIAAEEAEVEPVVGRKLKEASLSHALIKAGFNQVVDDKKYIKPEVLERSWVDSKSGSEALVDIKFKKANGVQIPVSRSLKEFEQRVLNNPMATLTWRLEVRNESALEPGPDCVDWPIKGVEEQFEAFRKARSVYFELISDGENEFVSAAHDFTVTKNEAQSYAQKYIDYVIAVYQLMESGENCFNELSSLLRLDSIAVTSWNYDGSYKEALLLGPTHPLKSLWLSGWSSLGEFWIKQSEKVAQDIVVGSRNSLLQDLSLTHFPYVLPNSQGHLMVALDSLHPYWSVLASAQEEEPQALLDTLKSALSIKNDYQQDGKQSSTYLALKVERYLVQHPYVTCLSINVFNAGAASAIAGMLLSLKKKQSLKHIRFDIRLFVADPYAFEAGADLIRLLNRDEANSESELFQHSDSHLVPKLSVSLRAISEFHEAPGEFSAHLSMLFDVFPAEEVSVVKPNVDEQIAPVHGLYQDYSVDYIDENGVIVWDRHTRHGAARPIIDEALPDLMAKLPKVMSGVVASLATNHYSLDQVPVVRLSLGSADRALLNQLHEVSDWVFTVDRNLGIEFFDHGGKDARPDYLIDHSPELVSSNTHNFVITSRSTTEIEALLKGTLEQHQIVPDVHKATLVLDALRALSGRLALKLASNSSSKSEALGLALAKLYLEYQGVFKNQVVVPLDAHLELYSELKKADAELGSEISLKRTDLALFDLDAESRTVRCNLIEVKCYSEVGDLAKYETLKKGIAEQISESERVLQRHFDLDRSTPDRPDRLVKTQKLCVLLEHYLKRSERFGLLSADVVDEAKYLLRTLERGYKLTISRSGVIFDFGFDSSEVTNEVGIEFHRVGRNHVNELLSFEAAPSDEELVEPTLDSIDLSLPRLNKAIFLSKERDRTVSWDEIVAATNNSFPDVRVTEPEDPQGKETPKDMMSMGDESEERKAKEPESLESTKGLNTKVDELKLAQRNELEVAIQALMDNPPKDSVSFDNALDGLATSVEDADLMADLEGKLNELALLLDAVIEQEGIK